MQNTDVSTNANERKKVQRISNDIKHVLLGLRALIIAISEWGGWVAAISRTQSNQ